MESVLSLRISEAQSQRVMETVWLQERFGESHNLQNSELPVLPSAPFPLEIRPVPGPVQPLNDITVYDDGAPWSCATYNLHGWA